MAEWFDPQPTATELDNWIFPGGQPVKVNRWPHPQSNRTRSRFMLVLGVPPDIHTGSRGLIFYNRAGSVDPVNFPNVQRWGWFDFQQDINGFQVLESTLPVDVDGLEVILSCSVSPSLSKSFTPGCEIFAFCFGINGGAAELYYEWQRFSPRPWRWNFQSATYPATFVVEDQLALWPWAVNQMRFIAVPDCFEFFREP